MLEAWRYYSDGEVRLKNCYRDELVFYSERLMRILMEEALNFLPYEDIEVEVQPGTM